MSNSIDATSASSRAASTVTGKVLADCKSKRERLALACGLVRGDIALATPTVTQAARLAGVSPGSVRHKVGDGRAKRALADLLAEASGAIPRYD